MHHVRATGTVGAGSTSAAYSTVGLVSLWVHTYGHSSHSAQVQVTLDGTTWIAYGTPSTAATLLELPMPAAAVRVVTTGGSGSMSFCIAAMDPRSAPLHASVGAIAAE